MTSTGAELNSGDGWLSHQSDRDDIPIIGKIVIMVESEEPATFLMQASRENVQALKEDSDSDSDSDSVRTGEMPDKAKRLLYINQLS